MWCHMPNHPENGHNQISYFKCPEIIIIILAIKSPLQNTGLPQCEELYAACIQRPFGQVARDNKNYYITEPSTALL